jgi:hypothetical protein
MRRDVVVGAAELDVHDVRIDVDGAAQARGADLALFLLHVDAAAVPAEGRRVFRMSVAPVSVLVAVTGVPLVLSYSVDARAEHGLEQHRGRLAVEVAARGVGLHVDADRVGDLELEAGVDAVELGVLGVGPVSRKYCELAKVPLVTTQPLAQSLRSTVMFSGMAEPLRPTQFMSLRSNSFFLWP